MRKRRRPRGERKRGIYVLPNLITTASMLSGFFAIISSVEGRFEHAALAIVAASLFDALDGRIARLTKTESNFGTEYDSLSDLLSFGLAPAVLAYMWALKPYGRFGWLAAFLFTACGALRLARFNAQKSSTDSSYFTGLPIPAAAVFIAATILFYEFLSIEIKGRLAFLVMMYVLSFLMVSTVKYFSFKNLDFFRKKSFNTLVAGILLFIVVAAKPYIMVLALIAAYVVSGPIVTYIHYKKRRSERSEESKECQPTGAKNDAAHTTRV